MIKQFLVLYLFLIPQLGLISEAAIADRLDDGISAVDKQDFKAAYRIFKQLADQGNAEAQYNLAILYRQGKGVASNNKQAFKWFLAAAQQGLVDAQFYVGYLFDMGQGTDKDGAMAVQWYKKAAQLGHPLAQANLGAAYAAGEGVKQDIVQAFVWFGLAAAQGIPSALQNRNELRKHMSDELIANAQRLTQVYFDKYVAPFQPKPHAKMNNSGFGGHFDHSAVSRSPTKSKPSVTTPPQP